MEELVVDGAVFLELFSIIFVILVVVVIIINHVNAQYTIILFVPNNYTIQVIFAALA